jgi:NAD(P)-dependent dehydrogenase (short-subunit alcohol dehydrogenase family)
VALVTGGNRAIGLATAKRFVSEGAYVFITGRRQKELDATVKEIGKNITAVQSDVSNLTDLPSALADKIKPGGGRAMLTSILGARLSWDFAEGWVFIEKIKKLISQRQNWPRHILNDDGYFRESCMERLQ